MSRAGANKTGQKKKGKILPFRDFEFKKEILKIKWAVNLARSRHRLTNRFNGR
jgi:hypothetical protein